MVAHTAELKDKNDDTVYPITVAGSVVDSDNVSLQTRVDNGVFTGIGAPDTPTPWIDTSDIIDGAVTADKIDPTTFVCENGTVTPVAVGTSFVTLKTINITQKGLYCLWAGTTRSVNSSSGALVFLCFKKNGVVIVNAVAPTIANYAGNMDTVTQATSMFQADAGDSITIEVSKDRNNFSSNIGCIYSFARVA